MFNQTFWSPEKKAFAFALDQQNRRVDELSVLTTVPMWFGLTDQDKTESTIQQLAEADHQTDWGMRIISNRSPLYNGSGYHFGSVWPLFTGWASVGEYRYHQAFPAYANLRANALLALDGSLGHVAEVLSGDYYQPLSTNSPHQIWSAAMVVSPILRGMLGIETDAQSHTLTFAPHVPAEWRSFSVDNLRVGAAVVSVSYQKTPGTVSFRGQAHWCGRLHAGVVACAEPAQQRYLGRSEWPRSAIPCERHSERSTCNGALPGGRGNEHHAHSLEK